MLLTEKEARQKWCPAARAEATWRSPAGDVFLTTCGNIFMKDGEEIRTNCIASDCMWWRWHEAETPEQLKARASKGELRMVGYCGMAGKP